MTKKIIFFTVMFAILLGINTVFADMGAPMIEPYTAVVSNPEGAKCYNIENYEDNTLKEVREIGYNEEIDVEYEQTINGVDYANARINNNYCMVKISDLNRKDGQEYQGEIDTENKVKAKVITKAGIEMYKGPSYSYSKIGATIPFNEEIIGYWVEDRTIDSWIYVNYKNQNGWINILDEKLGLYEKSEYCMKLFTFKKCNIYQDNEIVMEIPENTVVEDFLETDQWSRSYYVTYNGVSGTVSEFDIGVQCGIFERLNTSENEITLYKTAEEDGEIAYQGPITEEEKKSFIVIYREYDVRGWGWFYLRCNDKEGWIKTEYSYNDQDGITTDYEAIVINPDGAEYYEIDSQDSIVPVGKIEVNQKIDVDYETTHDNEKYARYNVENKTYLVKTSDLENINLKAANIPAELFEEMETEETSQIEETKTDIVEERAEEENVVKTPQIVTICVVCAVVIFLMAIVIIALVNKNKLKNSEKENNSADNLEDNK